MANKKVQLKNNANDNLYPVVRQATIEDFEHGHEFVGTEEVINSTGTYSKATGITINSITPTGQISQLTFTGTTTLTINDIAANGVQVVTDVANGGVNTTSATFVNSVSSTTTSTGNIKYVESISESALSITKGDYTPAGTVNSSFTGNQATISMSGTPSGTITLTGGSNPSLTDNTTSTSGIKYIKDFTISPVTTTTTAINNITNAGVMPTFVINSTSTGGTKVITGVGSLNTTTVNVITGITDGNATLDGALGGDSNRTLVLNCNYTAPTKSSNANVVTSVNLTGTTSSYIHWTNGTVPQTTSVNVVNGVSGGSISTKTISYLHFNAGSNPTGATFTGNPMNLSTTYTPSGIVNSTFAGTKTNNLVTNITGGNITPVTKYLDVNTGNAITSVTATGPTETKGYLHATTTGNITKPTFTGTPITPTGNITLSETQITVSTTYTPKGNATSVK